MWRRSHCDSIRRVHSSAATIYALRDVSIDSPADPYASHYRGRRRVKPPLNIRVKLIVRPGRIAIRDPKTNRWMIVPVDTRSQGPK